MHLVLLSLYALVSSLNALPSVPYGIIHPTQQMAERFGPGIFRNPIKYAMGNPVLTDDVNIYLIYYGKFEQEQKSIIEDFINGIDKTSWFAINKKYYYQKDSESEKVYADGNVRVAGTIDVDYTKGKTLSGNALPEIIQEAIDTESLPEDTSAVYFVLTAGDVKESIRSELGRASFCSSYCGYHVSWKLTSGNRIIYSQVGVPSAWYVLYALISLKKYDLMWRKESWCITQWRCSSRCYDFSHCS